MQIDWKGSLENYALKEITKNEYLRVTRCVWKERADTVEIIVLTESFSETKDISLMNTVNHLNENLIGFGVYVEASDILHMRDCKGLCITFVRKNIYKHLAGSLDVLTKLT